MTAVVGQWSLWLLLLLSRTVFIFKPNVWTFGTLSENSQIDKSRLTVVVGMEELEEVRVGK